MAVAAEEVRSGGPTATDAPAPARGRRPISLAGLLCVLATCAGAVIGTHALADNSFFTHLQTGRFILAGHFPRADPYTFTAHGHPWVVQSWLAEVIIAAAAKLAGGLGVRLVVTALCAALGGLAWRLTRPARSVVARLVIVIGVLVVGSGMWVERPLLFGLVCLALVLVVLEERRDPRWLVPILWVWVNTHGSFPLGVVLVLCWMVGRRLDGEWRGDERRYLLWIVIGTLAGAIGPVGPALLIFPAELLSRSSILHRIVEWQAPAFTGVVQRVFLGEVLAAVLVLARRPKYRDGLLLAVFVGAALLGSRNVVVASLVVVPGLARGLRGVGSLDGARRSRTLTLGAAAVAVAAVLMGVSRLSEPSWNLKSYPVQAVTWMDAHGLTTPTSRIVSEDTVGNYLELRFHGTVPTFVDDRYAMFPTPVIHDVFALYDVSPGWKKALQRWKPTAVLWKNDAPLVQVLRQSPDWRRAYHDKRWSVFLPSS